MIPTEKENQSQDIEIDIFDVISFFWQIRWFIAGGLLAGLLFGVGLVLTSHSKFEASVPTRIDPSTLPAITEPSKVAEAYDSALTSSDMAFILFSTLEKSAPTFADNLKKSGSSVNDLVQRQILADKPHSALVRVKVSPSGRDFHVESHLPVSGLGNEAGSNLVDAVNVVADSYNIKMREASFQSTQAWFDELQKNRKDVEEKSDATRLAFEVEMNSLRTELFQLEYHLRRQAKGLAHSQPLSTVSKELVAPPSFFITDSTKPRTDSANEIPTRVADLQIHDDAIIGLIALLKIEKRMTDIEAKKAYTDLAALRLRMEKTFEKFQTANSSVEAARLRMQSVAAKLAVPPDRASMYLPKFATSKLQNTSGQKFTTAERKINSRSKTNLLISTLGGSFLGLFVGALFWFFKKNELRLRSVLNRN